MELDIILIKKFIAIGLLLYMSSFAFARDKEQYAQVDPEIKKWIEDLKDKGGVSCCDTADGYDVQWDVKDNKYRVFINKKWYVVPDRALLSIPNKIKVARVWYSVIWTGEGVDNWHPNIRCFLPGTQS